MFALRFEPLSLVALKVNAAFSIFEESLNSFKRAMEDHRVATSTVELKGFVNSAKQLLANRATPRRQGIQDSSAVPHVAQERVATQDSRDTVVDELSRLRRIIDSHGDVDKRIAQAVSEAVEKESARLAIESAANRNEMSKTIQLLRDKNVWLAKELQNKESKISLLASQLSEAATQGENEPRKGRALDQVNFLTAELLRREALLDEKTIRIADLQKSIDEREKSVVELSKQLTQAQCTLETTRHDFSKASKTLLDEKEKLLHQLAEAELSELNLHRDYENLKCVSSQQIAELNKTISQLSAQLSLLDLKLDQSTKDHLDTSVSLGALNEHLRSTFFRYCRKVDSQATVQHHFDQWKTFVQMTVQKRHAVVELKQLQARLQFACDCYDAALNVVNEEKDSFATIAAECCRDGAAITFKVDRKAAMLAEQFDELHQVNEHLREKISIDRRVFERELSVAAEQIKTVKDLANTSEIEQSRWNKILQDNLSLSQERESLQAEKEAFAAIQENDKQTILKITQSHRDLENSFAAKVHLENWELRCANLLNHHESISCIAEMKNEQLFLETQNQILREELQKARDTMGELSRAVIDERMSASETRQTLCECSGKLVTTTQELEEVKHQLAAVQHALDLQMEIMTGLCAVPNEKKHETSGVEVTSVIPDVTTLMASISSLTQQATYFEKECKWWKEQSQSHQQNCGSLETQNAAIQIENNELRKLLETTNESSLAAKQEMNRCQVQLQELKVALDESRSKIERDSRASMLAVQLNDTAVQTTANLTSSPAADDFRFNNFVAKLISLFSLPSTANEDDIELAAVAAIGKHDTSQFSVLEFASRLQHLVFSHKREIGRLKAFQGHLLHRNEVSLQNFARTMALSVNRQTCLTFLLRWRSWKEIRRKERLTIKANTTIAKLQEQQVKLRSLAQNALSRHE